MTCQHKRIIRLPWFPSDRTTCSDCGLEFMAGYANAIRDYYVPGDPPWRRQSDCLKWEWLRGGDDLKQCPECCFVGTIDDFDVMGASGDNLFCNQCGVEFEQQGLECRESQGRLFD